MIKTFMLFFCCGLSFYAQAFESTCALKSQCRIHHSNHCDINAYGECLTVLAKKLAISDNEFCQEKAFDIAELANSTRKIKNVDTSHFVFDMAKHQAMLIKLDKICGVE